MEQETVLNDKNIQPNEELTSTIIGDKQLIWNQVMSYLYDNNKDISEVWKYYNDGKSWLFRSLKKKKTIFWIKVLEDTFRIAFWYPIRLESAIIESNLPDSLKIQCKEAKTFNKTRCIYIDIQDSNDLINIKMLIDYKLSNL